jgi:hypothetical protein
MYNKYLKLKISAIILSQKSPSILANEEQVVGVATNLSRTSVFGDRMVSKRKRFGSR